MRTRRDEECPRACCWVVEMLCFVVSRLPPKRGERYSSWRICAVVVVPSVSSLRSVEREESRGVFDAIVVVPSVCSLRNVERGLGRRKAPSETWREIVGVLSPVIVAHNDAANVERLPPKRERAWRVGSQNSSLRSVEREKAVVHLT